MSAVKKKVIIVSILIILIGAICLVWLLTGGFVFPGGETTEKYRSNLVLEDMANEIVAALWEQPRGYFILDNFLYYGYGKERYNVRTFTGGGLTGHDNFVYLDYKDFRFARLNLDTMENEEISRQVYEDTVAYMEFIDWRDVSEPITKINIFVWLNNDNGVYFTLRNGANPIYKTEWYENLLYHIEPSSNNRYVPPALITNSIDELNRMLSEFPDILEVTIYKMNANHFTEAEMANIINKIEVPDNCDIIMTLW
jgi:hypothetical protein